MDLIFITWGAFIVLMMAFALFSSNKKSYGRIHILRQGIRTQGEVIAMDFVGLDLLHRYPIVRFKTTDGRILTQTSKERVHVTDFQKGQTVEVCYLPAAPEQFVIVAGLDVLVKSRTQPKTYRLAKGQEPRSGRRSK
ncbi:DUF3592 domain-containing protein [Hymenobacter metallicola]|uniref:DUF3592 domain-containing protein n=1 Tax=Hymenobacter metallicola TaxID=2563114 RepID=UPI003744848E